MSYLFSVVYKNNIDIINKLVNDTNVNSQNNRGQTLFHYAVLNDRHDIAEILLKKGANFSITCSSGRNVLHDMAFDNELNTCLWLISQFGMDPATPLDDGSCESAITHYGKWFDNNPRDDDDLELPPPLTEEEKSNCIMQLIEARSNYIREQNWQRRKVFICSLFISEMLLLKAKKTANAIFQENLDKSKKLTSISRKTKAENMSFLKKKVFGEEGIARKIISYI
jgi:ankyrin repeat protein